MNCYTYSALCNDCGAGWYLGQMMVSLPLATTDMSRYVCPKCYVGVTLPRRIEARFLQDLSVEQSDSFGNPSSFRSQLASDLKPFAQGLSRYVLISLPTLEIICPEDGMLLEGWANYPESPSLLCVCGSRNVQAEFTGEIGGGVITPW